MSEIFSLKKSLNRFTGWGFSQEDNEEKSRGSSEKVLGKRESLPNNPHKPRESGSIPGQIEERFESCLWITIKELVSRKPVAVQEDTSLEEIFSLFGKHPYHIFPVVNKKNELVGIIDLDIILEILLLCMMPREKYTHLTAVRSLGTEAKDIMVAHPVTISLNATLKDASDLMMKYRYDHICVIENGKLAGIVSKRDIVKEICKRRKEEKLKGEVD